MSLTKIRCPECDAALKSEDGFEIGEEVTCPKCNTAFAVPKPKAKAVVVEDEVEPAEKSDKPKKKKKKAADEPRSYKNSPLRYAILGVLVLVMIVLGVLLYLKKGTVEPEKASNDPPPNPPQQPINIQPVPPQPKLPNFPTPKSPGPKVNPKQPAKQPAGGGGAGGSLLDSVNPLSPIFGTTPTPAQAKQLVAKYGAALVGSWVCESDGAKDEVAYLADGTFVASRTGTGAAKASGKYTVIGPAGASGLKLKLETDTGTRTITISFDGDTLEHPTLEKGVTATFKRK